MKKLSILLLFIIVVLMNTKINAQQSKPDTLNGVVEEYEYDSEGNLISVIFSVLDEDFNAVSYIVEKNEVSSELFDLVGENIDVIGITEDKNGNKTITVLEYFVSEEDDFLLPDDTDEDR